MKMNKCKVSKSAGITQLIVKSQKGQQISERELCAINQNEVNGLIPLQVASKQSSFKLIYNVTGFISLKRYLRTPLSRESFARILKNILLNLKAMQSAHFNLQCVYLDLKRVLVNPNTQKIYFVYVPVQPFESDSSLREFLLGIIQFATFESGENTEYVKDYINILNSGVNFSMFELEEYIKRLTGEQIQEKSVNIECPKCHTKIVKKVNYCPACGSRVSGSTGEMNRLVYNPLSDINNSQNNQFNRNANNQNNQFNTNGNNLNNQNNQFNTNGNNLNNQNNQFNTNGNNPNNQFNTNGNNQNNQFNTNGNNQNNQFNTNGNNLNNPNNQFNTNGNNLNNQNNQFNANENNNLHYEERGQENNSVRNITPPVSENNDTQDISDGTSVLGDSQIPTTVLGSERLDDKIYPYLIWLKNNEKIPVDKLLFSVGSRPNNDYVVTGNTAVSREHAKIITRNKRCYIFDEKSTNGTFVDGRVIAHKQEVEIFSGTKLRFADEDFMFCIE